MSHVNAGVNTCIFRIIFVDLATLEGRELVFIKKQPNSRISQMIVLRTNRPGGLTKTQIHPMKRRSTIFNSRAVSRSLPMTLILLTAIVLLGSSCGLVHSLFGPKYGCPSDGKNVGAERILSGEKVPKAPKFKA